MIFSEFLKSLPEEKQDIYQKVYDARLLNETNMKLAKSLGVQIETVRHDLIHNGWIKPKKTQYRKKWWELSLDGIKEAAEAVGVIGKTALELAAKVPSLLG
jgi:hypothetical protein